MVILLKVISTFNKTPTTTVMTTRKPQNSYENKAILSQKRNTNIINTLFQSILQIYLFKTSMILAEKFTQPSGIEDLEVNS